MLSVRSLVVFHARYKVDSRALSQKNNSRYREDSAGSHESLYILYGLLQLIDYLACVVPCFSLVQGHASSSCLEIYRAIKSPSVPNLCAVLGEGVNVGGSPLHALAH